MFRIVCNGHRTRDRGALPDACGEHHDAYAEQQHYNDAYALQHDIGSDCDKCVAHHNAHIEHNCSASQEHNGGHANNEYGPGAVFVVVCRDVHNS